MMVTGMLLLHAAALSQASGEVGTPNTTFPVGTIGHGTCGVFTDPKGFGPPPGGVAANGNCKKDPKGWHPHLPSFEDCVAFIEAENCTMARYVSWGITEGGMWCNSSNSSQPCQLRGESSCGWYSECDFAHLCKNCSTDTGPQCPTTKCPAAFSNFTSMVVAPWKPPAPAPAPPGPPTPPGPPSPTPPGPPKPPPPPPPKPFPPKPSPPGPERSGMIYNGTCLAPGAGGDGGDCNAMSTGSFQITDDCNTLEKCVAKVAKCKYGNYATYNQGGWGCGWSETCPLIGTPQFCVDCHAKPNGSCAALSGTCPSFIQFITAVIKVGPPARPPLPNFTCTGPPPAPPAPFTPMPAPAAPPATGTPWEHVGPWNIFDDKDNKGEAGTLAAAASPKANPNIIYAGGHNNGVSSGVLKSVDGGEHWTRNSSGIFDTHIWGVFVHPSDPQGKHVLVGTSSGIYESKDGAASWQFANETAGFGPVISFAEVTIGGKQYIAANHGSSISSVPVSGGLWQTAKAPGGTGIAQLSTVTTAGESEVVMCVTAGWEGGVYYGKWDTPTNIEWNGPLNYTKNVYESWSITSKYRHETYDDFWDSCPPDGAPKDCHGHWHWVPCKNESLPAGAGFSCSPDGGFVGPDQGIEGCRSAVINGTLGFKPAAYLHKAGMPHEYQAYSGMCFASDNFETWAPPQPASPWANNTVKDETGQTYCGRGIGEFPVNSTKIECFNAAVNPNDRNHFIYSDPKTHYNWDSHDGGTTVRKMAMAPGNQVDAKPGDLPHNHGTFYVAIDGRGWSYCASEGGAYVSRDNGTSFDALHMVITPRGYKENATEFPLVNRVLHDYQVMRASKL